AMSAISPTGKLYFTVFEGSFPARVFIGLLDRLTKHFSATVHLVVDQHSVHRSKAVRAWVHDHAERIELHFLPPYSPHLNPDELVNADLKRHLTDEVITDRQRMRSQVRSFFRSVQRLAGHVRSYFQALHTSYITRTNLFRLNTSLVPPWPSSSWAQSRRSSPLLAAATAPAADAPPGCAATPALFPQPHPPPRPPRAPSFPRPGRPPPPRAHAPRNPRWCGPTTGPTNRNCAASSNRPT